MMKIWKWHYDLKIVVYYTARNAQNIKKEFFQYLRELILEMRITDV